jgi:methionine sulfoxide reductase heme-binding subunit
LRIVLNSVDGYPKTDYPNRMIKPSPRRWQDWLFWAILAIPALLMLPGYQSGAQDAADMLHPTGETSARLMIVAMMIGPIADLIGQPAWLRWLMKHRRHLGVAAFAYAVLHLIFYVIDMEFSPALMLDEIGAPGIWTGWLATLLMLLPALASSDAAMRTLRRNWKRVQQLAYGAALLTIAHWIFLEYETGPALVHFTPLILLNMARIAKNMTRRTVS